MGGERLKLVTRNEHTKIGGLGEEVWDKAGTLGSGLWPF
jgi:hypothetical protein